MLRTLIVLPDGTEIFSGAPGAAVVSTALTRAVNGGKELTLGSTEPSVLTCELTEAAGVQILPGQWLQVYRSDGSTRQLAGNFLVSQTQRKSGGILRFQAEDCLCRLEQDVSDWLAELEGWPFTLQELAERVCRQCGLTLDATDMLNGGVPVDKIAGRGITGSRLLGWIAALGGCFVTAEGTNQVRFGWYAPADRTQICPTADEGAVYDKGDLLLPDVSGVWSAGELTLTGHGFSAVYDNGDLALTFPRTFFYYANSLTRGVAVQPIQSVLLRQNDNASVVSYPPAEDGANVYLMEGNALLGGMAQEHQQAVAQALYQRLAALAYTACTLEVPASSNILPGQMVSVTDSEGSYTMAVMHAHTKNGRTQLTCTGSARRDDPEALRDLQIQAQSGKFLSLDMAVDGLELQTGENAQWLSRLELDTEHLRTRVTRQEENEGTLTQRLSDIEQTAAGLDISVKTIQTDGVDRVVTKSGYSFTDEGLVISKQGHQMRNLLDHTGMYVTRDEEVILQASHRGVEATDVTVRNYLIVGEHARFEDYDGGTACFYI